jgi:MoaA/NifB/PqqE/SkfB family radical SAM enzyme
MKKYRSENQHYDAWLQWNLTSQCNFGCEYCFGKTPPNRQTIFVINTEAVLRTLESTGKIFRIGFTGGEPFLIPNFTSACKELSAKHFISINTNLALGEADNFANEIDPARVLNVHASIHFKELIDKGLFERFISNYKILVEKEFNIYAEAIAYPGIIDKVDYYKSLADRNKIEFIYAPFFGKFEDKFYPRAYTEEELKIFDISSEQISAHYQIGNICNAGYNAAVISPTGNISPCFNVAGNMGNINKEINFSTNKTVCPASKCVCPLNKYDNYLFNKSIL